MPDCVFTSKPGPFIICRPFIVQMAFANSVEPCGKEHTSTLPKDDLIMKTLLGIKKGSPKAPSFISIFLSKKLDKECRDKSENYK